MMPDQVGPGASVNSCPPYRMVWHVLQDTCTVTCAVDGFDAVLNGSAGRVLELLQDGMPERIDLSDSGTERFMTAAIAAGWITNRQLNGKLTRLDHDLGLERIQIEFTTLCNLRCSYCYSESGPTKSSALTLQQVRGILSEACSLGCTWVDFTGGEFFLYRHWEEALAFARNLGLVVTIHTNGMALTQANVTTLVNRGIRTVQVSLDSHLATVHDAARGMPGALDKTVAGIRRAVQAGLKVKACVMVHKQNRDAVADTVRWLNAEIGVPVMLDRIIKAGGELTAAMGLETREYYEIIAPLIGRNVVSSKICESPAAASGAERRVQPACGVAHNFVYITADGEFALCPTMTSRDRPIFAGPRIAQMGLTQAWLSSYYFNGYRHLNCANAGICPAATKCGGGCRSNAYVETGELTAPDALACNVQKNATVKFVDFRERYAASDYTLPEALR